MSSEPSLVTFCRLCLTETKNKVSIFGNDEENVINLLMLIELDIDPDNEPNAGICFDCIVTLEGFFQFKEQCHVNDEFIKTIPPNDSEGVSAGSDEDDDEFPIHCEYLVEDSRAVKPAANRYDDSEEEGLVEDIESYEPPKTPKWKSSPSPDAKRPKLGNVKLDPVESTKPVRTRKPFVMDQKEMEKASKEFNISALERMQVMQNSYPDYFHFEKGKRSVYYTLVFYGEKFNSAIFGDRFTIWQCANRRRFQCLAQVCVTNDYTDFERRYEHTHGEVKETEVYDLYTPKQALPEVFKVCRQSVIKRKARGKAFIEKKKRVKTEQAHLQHVAAEEVVEHQEDDNESLLRVLHEGAVDERYSDNNSAIDESEGEESPDELSNEVNA